MKNERKNIRLKMTSLINFNKVSVLVCKFLPDMNV